MKKKITLLILQIFLAIVIFNSCQQSTNNDPKKEQFVFEEETKEINANTFTKISSLREDGKIIFEGESDELDKLVTGDIIATEPIDAVPAGFLRKVISVSKSNGQTIVNTEEAALADAFKTLRINETIELTMDNISKLEKHIPGIELKKGTPETFWPISAENALLIDLDNDPTTEYNNVTLNGSIDLTPSFNLKIELDDGTFEELAFTCIVTEEVDLTLTIGGAFEQELPPKKILTTNFHPITIWISWFPLVINPVLVIEIGAEMKVEARIDFHVKQSSSYEVGLKYNSVWSPINEFQNSFVAEDPELKLTATAKGWAGPKMMFLLYGIAGPYTRLEGYLRMDADIYRSPAWQIFGGANVLVGFDISKISSLGSGLENPDELTVVKYEKLLLEAIVAHGKIEGSVKDAVTLQPIENVQIKVIKDQIVQSNGYTDQNGDYSIEVAVGEDYSAIFSKSGYIEASYNNISIDAIDVFNLQQLLQIDQSFSGNGDFGGQVVNALNGVGVDGINLKLRDGMNNQADPVIKTTSTNGGGYYLFSNVAAGNYTVEASANGFTTTYFSVYCLGNTSTGNQNASITPELDESELRVILTWGLSPDDLDSHLTGPSSDGSRYHIYFSEKTFYNYGSLAAELDLDDTSSYGPETITIYGFNSGLYRYSVHDYTNRDANASHALSNSDAQVRLYQGGQLLKVYYVPANEGGTLWTVFEIQNGQFVTINNMSYESSCRDVPSQSGVDRTDAKMIKEQSEK